MSSFWWNADAPMFDFITGKLRKGNADTGRSVGDTYAALTRQQWNDYLNVLGVPQENQLIDYVSNPATVTNAMAEASQDVNQAFDRQQLNTERRLQGLGLSLSPEEAAASIRATSLARATADVGAQNRSRDMTIARQQSIIGNPTPQIGGLA